MKATHFDGIITLREAGWLVTEVMYLGEENQLR